MRHDKKNMKIASGLHLGKCRLCGKATKAADPFWTVRCPESRCAAEGQ